MGIQKRDVLKIQRDNWCFSDAKKIIITKTSIVARPVSLEQITMRITRKRLRFIQSWRCQKCCTSTSTSTTMAKNKIYRNCKRQPIHNQLNKCMDRQYIVIGLIGLVLFGNWSTFVTAASKNIVRSISNSNGNNPYQQNINWMDFQRESLNQRSLQIQSPELGNIFSQLLFIQSRQRNASELAGNIFFKYYNT